MLFIGAMIIMTMMTIMTNQTTIWSIAAVAMMIMILMTLVMLEKMTATSIGNPKHRKKTLKETFFSVMVATCNLYQFILSILVS